MKRTLTASDVIAAIMKWPGLYEDENGRRFQAMPVSQIPSQLVSCGWRRVSHLNHASDYTSMGLQVVTARYVGGVHAKRFCSVVVAKGNEMAGVASVRSIKEAREILKRETNDEVRISANDGEYRVNKRGGREATAAYTSDLTDAVGTGIAMYKKGEWGAPLKRMDALRELINAVAEEYGDCDHVDELLKVESIKNAFADAMGAE